MLNTYKTKEDFINFLENTLIPDLKRSGNDATAEDFEEAIYWITKKVEINDIEKIVIGEKIGEVLGLKKHFAYAEDNEKTRYSTTWGSKTNLGLYETVNRIIQERGR